MRFADTKLFMLPGGYVIKDEDLEDAALRIFNEWTGVQNNHLEQFYTSGKADRNSEHLIRDMLQQTNKLVSDPWFDQRKISVCYFALLNETEINPVKVDFFVSEYQWTNISEIPALLFDHNHIIRKAIEKMQDDLDHILIDRPLFKEEFTMRELQKLYEAVFQKSFTRTNFQRRMLNLDILERIGKHYTGKAHKAPYLYRFKRHHLSPDVKE
jgi:ADP-ribose pyrophosphatase YjhB (NUDIX family)